MGKAQSKRSVDITTETKKGPDGGEEVTGKLEKIEDIDQKQVNGDATPQEKSDAAGGGEKKDAPDETENDKDLTTEKSAAEAAAAAAATTPSPTNADGSGDQTSAAAATETSPKEDGNATADTPVKEGEEISPLAEDSSAKKQKKDKTKKRWSFRSLSFGKKDKSKPKNESPENAPAAAASAENEAAATNGEAAETSQQQVAEGAIEEAPKTDEAVGTVAAETKTVEAEKKIENGDATEAEQKQMNGQKTPTPTDESATVAAAAEQKKSNETNNETVAAAAVTSPPPAAAASIETANEKVEQILSNGTADAEKNGIAHDVEEKATAAVAEESKSIPVEEKPHQNGTNGDEAIEELSAATKTLQIEVKIEHPNDSNNSTTITSTSTTNTTITINPHTNTTTTTTNNTNTILLADNNIINTEPKTNADDELITTVHTTDDTTKPTITHTSNASIAPCEAQNESKLSDDDDDVAHNVQVVEVDGEGVVENQASKLSDVDEQQMISEPASEQHEQQQPSPPPLPCTAPPSQVVIFALKDEESHETNASHETVVPPVPLAEADIEPNMVAEIELNAENLTPSETECTPAAIEIVETKIETTAITTTVDENVLNLKTVSETIEVTMQDSEDDDNVEVIEIGGMSMSGLMLFAEQAEAQMTPEKREELFAAYVEDVLEDFEAEALNIVDQIDRELEKEEANDIEKEKLKQGVDENEAEEEAEIEPTSFDAAAQQQQLIDMDLCSQSSDENLLPPPPPATELLEEQEGENIIETLNDCIGATYELLIDSKQHHNGAGDQLSNDKHIDEFSADELLNKIEKMSLLSDEHPIVAAADLLMEPNFEIDANNLNLKQQAIVFNSNTITTINTTTTIRTNDNLEENNGNGFDADNENKNNIGDDKEMPTAKELKENAAAAEVKTQDLPVTCE